MANVDRRRPRVDPKVQELKGGATHANSDVDRDSRFYDQQFSNRDWRVLQGSVVVAIPQLGWHVVAVEGYGGLVRAQVAGQSDNWGTQSVRAIQSGTSVILAIQEKTKRGVILGNTPPEMDDPGREFIQSSFAGSWSGLNRDVANEQFIALTGEEVEVRGYDTNQLWDQHAGDWGCRTNLGATVLVDNLGIRLATDEVTEIYVDLLEQAVNISSRRLLVEADGLLIESAVVGNFACIAMGPPRWRQDDKDPLKLVDRRPDDKEYRESLAGWMLNFGELPALTQVPTEYGCIRPFQHIVCSNVSRGLDDEDITTIELCSFLGHTSVHSRPFSRSLQASEFTAILSNLPTYAVRIEQVPGIDFGDSLVDSRVQLFVSTGLSAIGDGPLFPQLQILNSLLDAAATPVSGNFLSLSEAYLPVINPSFFIYEPSFGLHNFSPQVVAENYDAYSPAFMARRTTEPSSYAPILPTDSPRLAGITVDKYSGDICLYHEGGAGIRITGNGVFIEGMQVRINSTKDIVLIGRDIQLSGNRNVTMVANRNTRVYSGVNLSLLSGNSGRGGTLIENRSTSKSHDLAEGANEPEKAVMSGINIKASKSNVSLLGGGVLVKAGDRANNIKGDVIIIADTGEFYTSAAGKFVQHSVSGRIDAFGPTRQNIQAINYYGQFISSFSGQVSASALWSDGDVVARSNVTATTGRVADSFGEGVGKMRPEAQQLTLRSLEQLKSQLREERNAARQTFNALQPVYFTKNNHLNSDVFVELSSAFPTDKRNREQYNCRLIQTTYQHEYRQSFDGIPLKPFEFMQVQNRPDAKTGSFPTHAWPGKETEVYFARKDGECRIGKLAKDWFDGQATKPATHARQGVSPADLFQTADLPEPRV